MGVYQITCITRDRVDPDWRIDAVGFAGNVYSIDQVINWIMSGEHQFWTVWQTESVWVEVRRHPTSHRYFLATEPDGLPLNNLSSLPECPSG